MHINDGILSAPVWLSALGLAAGGVAAGLRQIHEDDVPRVAMFTAVFFVASLIHVQIGMTSAHLVLNGLVGLVLGWAAFPAIFVGLTLQAAFFQFGGWTTLGANTVIMALPAVLCHLALGRCVRRRVSAQAAICGGVAGAAAIALGAFLAAVALVLTNASFSALATVFGAAHAGIMIVEGLLTAAVIGFLRRVRPEVLAGGAARMNHGDKRKT